MSNAFGGILENIVFQTDPVPDRDMTQLKMVLESTLYSCEQMELEALEQCKISHFTIDSGWTACLPFAFLAMQITA